MIRITYVTHDGTEQQVPVEIGSSVMEGAVQNQIEGIVAECGGACNCGTCHCFVEDAWTTKVPQPGEAEQAMLQRLPNSTTASRLSCQIEVTESLDGLVVHLPESQF